MTGLKAGLLGTAAALAMLAGTARAADTITIGALTNLEGPFAVPGLDGHRGVDLAVKLHNGMAGGKAIKILKYSSDATPDKAVAATRKAVEQDHVDIMIGPLSGDEGIAVKNYSKTHPEMVFVNGSSGAQATTLQDPSPNFYRFNTEGAQWMVGLGDVALGKGYKKMWMVAEDYGFPYSQVQGFMASYCAHGGHVVKKAWVPLGTKDYSSIISGIPGDVDALLIVLGGADAVNFLNQAEQAGIDKPFVGGSITGDFLPTAGRVLFFGEDVTHLPPHERIRRGLRRTYQSSLLFRNLTVRDNLFLATRGVAGGRFHMLRPGPRHPSRLATEALLDRVRLGHLADEPVAALSHGQLRQLEIGMALAGAPRLILFDEPAAGLSPAERRELVALLKAFPPHLGFVLIEHDLDIALRVVDQVTILHHGRVLKHGAPADIEADAEVQAIYMGGGRGPGH